MTHPCLHDILQYPTDTVCHKSVLRGRAGARGSSAFKGEGKVQPTLFLKEGLSTTSNV